MTKKRYLKLQEDCITVDIDKCLQGKCPYVKVCDKLNLFDVPVCSKENMPFDYDGFSKHRKNIIKGIEI